MIWAKAAWISPWMWIVYLYQCMLSDNCGEEPRLEKRVGQSEWVHVLVLCAEAYDIACYGQYSTELGFR